MIVHLWCSWKDKQGSLNSGLLVQSIASIIIALQPCRAMPSSVDMLASLICNSLSHPQHLEPVCCLTSGQCLGFLVPWNAWPNSLLIPCFPSLPCLGFPGGGTFLPWVSDLQLLCWDTTVCNLKFDIQIFISKQSISEHFLSPDSANEWLLHAELWSSDFISKELSQSFCNKCVIAGGSRWLLI